MGKGVQRSLHDLDDGCQVDDPSLKQHVCTIVTVCCLIGNGLTWSSVSQSHGFYRKNYENVEKAGVVQCGYQEC